MMNVSSDPRRSALQELWSAAGLFSMALFVIVAYGILGIRSGAVSVRTLSLVFASIVLEAMPFMLFGAFVGGLIEAFVSRERMTALLPKRGWQTVLVAAGMGVLFPVCECAVVPVVRRLARKGLPPSAAIAYLLGGPIVNPIVAASTALAYKSDWRIVGLRMGLGYLIAVGVALAMGRLFRGKAILDKAVFAGREHDHACGCGHDHGHARATFRTKLAAAFRHGADDFVAVGHFLVIGAFIAALAQTYIDRKVFLAVATHPVVPSVAMMLLAILLNLCSEADAFIAASFRGLMPVSAQMAFMLIGPMFDLKLLLMYQGVFRKRAVVALAGLIFAAVFVAAFGLEFADGGVPWTP